MKTLSVRQINDKTLQPIKLPVVEEMFGGKFIGDFCVKAKGGGWTDSPIAIFYQPNPDTEKGHSHYFGIFIDDNNKLVITSGDNVFSEEIIGIVADDGEVIISRWRHDFVTSIDKSVFIDGGRDYTRCGISSTSDIPPSDRMVKLNINNDKLVVDEESISPNLKQFLGWNE